MNKQKPKLKSYDLVQKMKTEKGILFNITTEDEAIEYLLNVNNYLRTASYRKNYDKYNNGKNKGRYINLDFAYLQELSSIDLQLRQIIIKLCIDIEHALKVELIKDFEINTDDGYSFVKTFLSTHPNIIKKIEHTISSSYTSSLIDKYFTINGNREITDYSNCPIWVLVELLTFGDFITCYDYYYNNFNNTNTMVTPKNLLFLVKSLRNSCAHNNCIINNLLDRNARPPREISTYISKIEDISTNEHSKKLKCRPVLEFVTILYVYTNTVSDKIKRKRIEELKYLFAIRIPKNKMYFQKNSLLKSHYNFINKVLQNYFY